jgi:manganese transport protein
MVVGWGINSAMILMAAATFFKHKIPVAELQQAKDMLVPLLGNNAAVIFAVALLMAGIASTVTSAMAGGSIFAGFFGEPFDMKDNHSRLGVLISLIPAVIIIFIISNPFKGLIYSQMLLSIQLPITIFTQIYLTSSRKVMGKFSNSWTLTGSLLFVGAMVTYLNIRLLASLF